MRRNDVDLLVNACDPDREGEAIFRRIIHHAGVNKPTRRLWVASLEEEAIRQALAAMKPEGDYRGLADSAMIRAKADWLIDMNASRAYSLVYNTRFTVGRVQTPTLAMIVERDRQIESHKPTPFWKVVAPMGSWTLTGTHLENHGTAEALLEIVNQPDFAFGIYAVKRHRQHDALPRLYDLTNLQKDMSKLHGLTAAHTLTALQSLYEQRLTTYPRTDSRFITHDDLDALRKLTNGDRLASGFLDPAVRPAQPRLELTVNDAKVTGHTAILPTLQASGETLGQLGDDKRLVLTRVVRRMWEAVADDHVHDVTLVVANIDPDYDESHPNLLRISEADSRFTSCSDQTISLGWKGIEPTKTQEHDGGEDEEDAPAGNLIPVNLATGANAMPMPRSGARLVEGKIKPPKPYTEATLLAAMEHASRLLDDAGLKAALDDDESHSGGIGMPATRADVIEKLIRSAYVERKGKQLRSTEQGRNLINVVALRLKDVALTAEMEQVLSDVEHGNADPTQTESRFRAFAAGIPADAQSTAEPELVQARRSRVTESFGPCPRCGQPVVKTGKVWQCSTNKREKQPDGTWKDAGGCGWKLFSTIAGKTLTDANARRFLADGRIRLKGFISKAGRKFDAMLILDKEGGARFKFNDK
ncbi:topoisomerase C-terminal repeat-containing protein [Bifidobacterium longum]|uniref:type IA DNA topoisomerase n=1 Tax=Bifidobacterium longum TaxID=216816 RepID=UPI001C3841D6|nr:type IA DNA topoisomerase [Bifidobacterium longum]MBV4123456.1 topoisomerase C-terminal repeat-containing protein [Bifidobacterium longum]MBV4132885.1 topoisomerase C-terminal repeat-containing protein [Bifidobacterium longum]MBV4147681.1 topoisomerase C-terminal repeat-containing protein [Bifidobacterium longum]MBV4160376.1 topoisomerase C-terminal repeat-containing protein [Bifidobacterium longum]